MYSLVSALLVSVVSAQLTIYTIEQNARSGPARNVISVSCVNQHDELLNGAVYLRNGAIEDACLRESLILPNGRAEIMVNASCEGFYQCGRVVDDEDYILSKPIPLYAYPQPTSPQQSVSLEVTIGDSITLPCNTLPSVTGHYAIIWYHSIADGVFATVQDPSINDDYSLILTNTSYSDNGFYFCVVRATELSGPDNDITGPSITLNVFDRHVSPLFLSNLTLIENTAGENILYVKFKASNQNLGVMWYINNVMKSSTEREVSLQGQVKTIRSEVILRDMSLESCYITVVVINTDRHDTHHTATLTNLVIVSNTTSIARTATESPEQGAYPLSVVYTLGAVCVVLLLLSVMSSVISITLCCYRHKHRHSVSIIEPKKDPGIQELVPFPPSYQTVTSIAPNPVSTILTRVAQMYWNKEYTEAAILSSLQHVLIEVLQDKNLTNSPEMKICIKELRDEITCFADALQEDQRYYYSRQATYTKSHSTGTIYEIEPGTDEYDGGGGVVTIVPQMNDIAMILTQWIEKQSLEEQCPSTIAHAVQTEPRATEVQLHSS